MSPNIFISYSHADRSLVTPIVALLRASQALVFRDADTISPGKRWRNEIGRAIADASVVVVFWCHHAHSSEEVVKEFKAAIALSKDILPLLLDETPLPTELAEFQYIDFREVFTNGHGVEVQDSKVLASPAPALPIKTSPAPAKRSRIVSLAFLAIATLWFISAWVQIFDEPMMELLVVLSLLVVAGGLLIVVLLQLRMIGRKNGRQRFEPIKPEATTFASCQQVIAAKTIEAELMRRTRAKVRRTLTR